MPQRFSPSEELLTDPTAACSKPEGLTLSELVLQSESPIESFTKELGNSAAYSLIQAPLNGIVQGVDKSFGTEVLPSVQLIEPHTKAEFLSRNWHAQEIGNGVGMALPFLLMHSGTRFLAKKSGLDICQNAALTPRQYGNEVLLAATTGITYGAFLTPSDPKESLLLGRFKNAAEQGTSFAALAAAAGGMKLWGQSLETGLGGRLLRNDVLAATLAGLPAGCVSADAHSLLAGKGLSTWKERGKSMYGFMIVGGTLGLAHSFGESKMGGATDVTAKDIRSAGSRPTESLQFDLGERGRLGSSERPTEPVAESRETRKAREQAEAQVKLAEFLDKPNPTSLVESCRNIANELRRQAQDAETRVQEQRAFTQKRVAQLDDATQRLEQFAQRCGPDTTIADLNKLVDQLIQSNDLVARDLKQLAMAHSPAKLVVQEYGGYQYRILEDGSCIRTDGTGCAHDGHSKQIVFVDQDTARKIKDLWEDGELAGKSFPASSEFAPDTCPVQIGEAGYDGSIPPAVIADGTVTFPNVNGCAGSVHVGSALKPPEPFARSPAAVAREMAGTSRRISRSSAEHGGSMADYQAKNLGLLRGIIDTVEQFPLRFQSDNPARIFELPRLIKQTNPNVDSHILQPLIEGIYEHAPATAVFTTEKGSVYRLYGDGSLGRLKHNGITRDRCDNQYFTDPAQGQRLLDAANGDGMANFSLPVQVEPAVGLVPLSVHQAGRASRVLPTLTDGRLVWPGGYFVSFDGHIGHPITSLRLLTPSLTPPPAGGPTGTH